jgi:hypothetical protein
VTDVPLAARPPEPRGLAARVWAATFAYAAGSALLVQLVLLPHLVPAWHAGDGLLRGGDWVTFHLYASQTAERIRARGWSAFELRPMGQAPVGIASAIYALTWPRPWTLIPLDAALHATAAALLLRLLRGFVPDWRWATAGTAPFVLYPSALVWVSQLHKDGFFIAGHLCLLVGWAALVRHDPARARWRLPAAPLALVPVGFGLVWLVRPDLVVLAHAATAVALAVLLLQLGARTWRHPARWGRAAALLGVAVLATLAGAWPTRAPSRFLAETPTAAAAGRRAASTIPWRDDFAVNWTYPMRGVRAIPWDESPWLPAAVDDAAYRLALTREQFMVNYLDSRSTVDLDRGLYRATDLVRYLPRALQVALLAPPTGGPPAACPGPRRDGASLRWRCSASTRGSPPCSPSRGGGGGGPTSGSCCCRASRSSRSTVSPSRTWGRSTGSATASS